jgi:flavodoxin
MGRILIVYYSRSGHTRAIAEAMAARLGADIEAVQEPRDRSGIWGYLRSLREALNRRVVEIRPSTKDPAGYDLVILGTPVWAHSVCSPMRSYIAAHQQRIKALAVFCVEGGSGGSTAAGQIAALCGRAALSTLILTQGEIDQQRCAAKLDEFVRALAPDKAA